MDMSLKVQEADKKRLQARDHELSKRYGKLGNAAILAALACRMSQTGSKPSSTNIETSTPKRGRAA